MFEWFKKWHVILAIVIGVYMVIPKPDDPQIQWGRELIVPANTKLETVDGKTIEVLVETEVSKGDSPIEWDNAVVIDEGGSADSTTKDEGEGDADAEDKVTYFVTITEEMIGEDKPVRVKSQGKLSVKFPLAQFTWNLGQDLKGGTSLRYIIEPQEVVRSRNALRNIYLSWTNRSNSILDSNDVSDSVKSALRRLQANSEFPNFSESDIESIKSWDRLDDSERGLLDNAFKAYDAARIEGQAEDLVGPTIEKLNRRLNASGSTELNIVKAGNNEIEIKIPALSETEKERLKQTLQTTGALEFLILPDDDVLDGTSAKDLAPGVPDDNPTWYDWYDVLPTVTAADLYSQKELRPGPDGVLLDAGIAGDSRAKRESAKFNATFAYVTDRPSNVVTFTDKNGVKREARIWIESCLVQVGHPAFAGDNKQNYPISGRFLADAVPTTDSKTGQPAVSFTLEGQGVAAMERLTALHNEDDAPDDIRLLATAMDKKLYSASTPRSQLSDSIQVTGNFTREEVKQYVETLKSGQLPVSLTQISEDTVGPAEGADNVNRGILSLIIGSVLVFLFALAVYGRVGVLTTANLLLTIVLILAVMAGFLSTLTLPGIAGLVLTLGMAIDANILINERIREELEAGASGKTAIKAGFGKAFSAIIDGNVTTLITAVILAKVGTGAIAGFALTLSIGILCTLYVALLVYRTSIFFAYDKGLIREPRGVKIFKNPQFNFVRIGTKLAIVTAIFAVASFAFFLYEAFGSGRVMGIDFRGGTQVVMELNQPLTREAIQERLSEGYEETYENIQLQARSHLDEGTDTTTEGFTRWEIRVPRAEGQEADGEQLEAAAQDVRRDLATAFAPELVKSGFSVDVSDPTEVTLKAQIKIAKPDFEVARDEVWAARIADWETPTADSWFSDLSGDGLRFETDTSSEGTVQTMYFTLTGVSVDTAVNTVEKRKESFYNSIVSQLIDRNQNLGNAVRAAYAESTFPALADMQDNLGYETTVGRVRAEVHLSAPISIGSFEDEVTSLLNTTSLALLAEGNVTVTPQDATGEPGAEQASFFVIRSGSGDLPKVDQSDELPEAVVTLSGIKPKLEDWLDNQTTSDAYILSPFPQVSAIGSRVAGETRARAAIALLIALIAIVIYIGVRFRSAGWGYAAVIALVHDSVFTLGALGVMDELELVGALKFDLNAVAALLTVVGYSLNDTIVIFDRIREELIDDMNSKGKRPLNVVINAAINKTLSRTVLTSCSTFVVVLAMVILGGPAIKTFAWVLLFGLVFGTYSSVFRAGPLLILCTTGKRDLRAEIAAEEVARKEAERAEAEMMAQISVDRPAEEIVDTEVDVSDVGEGTGEVKEEANDEKA